MLPQSGSPDTSKDAEAFYIYRDKIKDSKKSWQALLIEWMNVCVIAPKGLVLFSPIGCNDNKAPPLKEEGLGGSEAHRTL